MEEEYFYTIISQEVVKNFLIHSEFLKMIKKSDKEKRIAMESVIVLMLNGTCEVDDQILMGIIQFVFPVQTDKLLKKMCFLFFEICNKTQGKNRKLKEEVFLICNALRNDLHHPNEYVRGAILRFLTRTEEKELIEPLVQSIFECLEHKNAYVRKNAIITVSSLYKKKNSFFSDIPNTLSAILMKETDQKCQELLILFLIETKKESVALFVKREHKLFLTMNSALQTAIIRFLKKQSAEKETQSLLHYLTESTSRSVSYEATTALLLITKTPSVIKEGIKRLIGIVIEEKKNNIKLFVLEKLKEIQKNSPGYFGDLVSEFTSEMFCSDKKVSFQATDLVLKELKTSTAVCIIDYLSDETFKWKDSSSCELILSFICTCGIRFPIVTEKCIQLLVQQIKNKTNGLSAVKHLRTVAAHVPEVQELVESIVMTNILKIKDKEIIGSFVQILQRRKQNFHEVISVLICCLENILSVPDSFSFLEQNAVLLKKTAVCVWKLFLKAQKKNMETENKLKEKVLLILTRICQTCVLLSDKSIFDKAALAINMILKDEIPSEEELFEERKPTCLHLFKKQNKEQTENQNSVDTPLDFEKKQLKNVEKSIRFGLKRKNKEDVYDLSGHTSNLFVEVQIIQKECEVILDFFIVNKTEKTVEDVFLELTTTDGLHFIEPNVPFIFPKDFICIKKMLRIKEAKTVMIFPRISYGKVEEIIQELQPIDLSVFRFITEESLNEKEFRKQWSVLEWENRIPVIEEKSKNLSVFVSDFLEYTAFKRIDQSLLSDGFVSFNVSAKNNFGGFILGNVSLAISGESIIGDIRLRCSKEIVLKDIGKKLVWWLSKNRGQEHVSENVHMNNILCC